MPELSKDAFGDALAKAFFPRGLSMDHVDPPFYGNWPCGPTLDKFGQHEVQKFLASQANSFQSLVADPDSLFLDGPSSCALPNFPSMDCDANQMNQILYGFPSLGLPNFPPLQLEDSSIDDSNSWMSDVLDDFPAISIPEFSPLTPAPSDSLSMISCLDFSPPAASLPLSMSIPPNPAVLETKPIAQIHPPVPLPSTAITGKLGVSNVRVLTPEESSCLSPTPKPLKPRGARRSPMACEKPKKVSEVEQLSHVRRDRQRKEDLRSLKMSAIESLLPTQGPKLEHVRRERQRRDDMSFKISTLECLLPPAGPNMKRDRASIVHDSVDYVKTLQQEVEKLKKVFSTLQVEKSTRPQLRTCEGSRVKNLELSALHSKKPELVEHHIQVEGEGDGAVRLEKLRCRSDYMSACMKALEQLNLDLCRCSVVKMFDFTICIIVAKPRLTSMPPVSMSSITAKLRSAVEVS